VWRQKEILYGKLVFISFGKYFPQHVHVQCKDNGFNLIIIANKSLAIKCNAKESGFLA
jgi:hypothetical protein